MPATDRNHEPFTGQIVRTLGLLIEMLGILALVFRTRTDQAGAPLPGSFPVRLVWIVVGVGFVLWLVGTVMIVLDAANPDLARRRASTVTQKLKL